MAKQFVRVRIEPSRRLSEIIGFPYYIERHFTVNELRKKGIIDEADISRMKTGEEITKSVRLA
jgi:DNA-binding Xre family transcriptional regulator